MFSRIVHASRISLTIGLVGVAISFVLGTIIGGISGYFGGAVDMIVQRVIEFLLSIRHPGVDGAERRGAAELAAAARPTSP